MLKYQQLQTSIKFLLRGINLISYEKGRRKFYINVTKTQNSCIYHKNKADSSKNCDKTIQS